MTAHRPGAVIGCKLNQNANEGCNSCARLAGLVLSFIPCFILLVIAPLSKALSQLRYKLKEVAQKEVTSLADIVGIIMQLATCSQPQRTVQSMNIHTVRQ